MVEVVKRAEVEETRQWLKWFRRTEVEPGDIKNALNMLEIIF
jgi:hypothetical protein